MVLSPLHPEDFASPSPPSWALPSVSHALYYAESHLGSRPVSSVKTVSTRLNTGLQQGGCSPSLRSVPAQFLLVSSSHLSIEVRYILREAILFQ